MLDGKCHCCQPGFRRRKERHRPHNNSRRATFFCPQSDATSTYMEVHIYVSYVNLHVRPLVQHLWWMLLFHAHMRRRTCARTPQREGSLPTAAQKNRDPYCRGKRCRLFASQSTPLDSAVLRFSNFLVLWKKEMSSLSCATKVALSCAEIFFVSCPCLATNTQQNYIYIYITWHFKAEHELLPTIRIKNSHTPTPTRTVIPHIPN